MAIVVVGGQTRNIGKSSAVAGLIAALPELEWTAFKVTQYGHGICSANGKPCDCETDSHACAISEERNRDSGKDSARFLAAGAVRSFWVRTRQGQLAEAMPRVRKELALARNAIIESNSILNFIKPDIYLTVLDPANRDFKISALHFLDEADAVLWSSPHGDISDRAELPEEVARRVRNKPQFSMEAPTFVSRALAEFVAKLVGSGSAVESSGIRHQ